MSIENIQSSPTKAEVKKAIRTVYGPNGLGRFNEQLRDNSRTPFHESVRTYREGPCTDHTEFFRHINQRDYAYMICDVELQGKRKKPLKIAQVGCSDGSETWSIAAWLDWQASDLPFHIYAYDTNPHVLEKTSGPYSTSLEKMSRHSGGWIGGGALKNCFDVLPDGRIAPNERILATASFALHDIVISPLPVKGYDAVVIENMLWHYPRATRNRILAHVLNGLKHGGTFLFEDKSRDSGQAPDYYKWVDELYDWGLHGTPSISHPKSGLLKYDPKSWIYERRGVKTLDPEEQVRVETALGVLAISESTPIPTEIIELAPARL